MNLHNFSSPKLSPIYYPSVISYNCNVGRRIFIVRILSCSFLFLCNKKSPQLQMLYSMFFEYHPAKLQQQHIFSSNNHSCNTNRVMVHTSTTKFPLSSSWKKSFFWNGNRLDITPLRCIVLCGCKNIELAHIEKINWKVISGKDIPCSIPWYDDKWKISTYIRW